MRSCQTCSLSTSECHTLCSDIQETFKKSRGYKTTYVNKEIGLSVVHLNQVNERLEDYLDNSGSFTEKFGHHLPTIRTIVQEHGTEKQRLIFQMWIDEKMSFAYIAEQLNVRRQSVHEVIYGHRNQGGLIRKIQKHLRSQGKLPAVC